jgi:hypothetical protein
MRAIPCALAFIAALTHVAQAAPPAASQPSSQAATTRPADDAELAAIERALGADRAARAEKTSPPATPEGGGGLFRAFQSLNPDLSFIADVALAAYQVDKPLLVGGHDPSRNGFTLQQLELAIGGAVDPYFRFDANLVLSQFGIEIEEVYATTLALPWNLQVRAGQFLTRFGRLNASHPHTWSFVDQTLVLGKFFGGEGNRGLGAELSVLLPLPWVVEVYGSLTDASGESTARSFFGGSDASVKGPADFQTTVALKQFFPLSDDWSLSVGLSTALGPNASGKGNRTDLYGADLYLKYRPVSFGSYTVVSLDAEWLLRRRQVPEAVLQDQGFYAYLFFRFAQRWAVAGRYELVSGLAADPLDPEWTGIRQRVAGNLTFWPTEFSRLRLQYSYDRPSWRDGYHGVVLAFEFAVGAHGSHKF